MPATFPFRRIPSYTLAVLALLVMAICTAFFVARSQSRAALLVTHTIQVQVSLTRVLERTRAMDAAVRGYRIASTDDMVDDFTKASRDIQIDLDRVYLLTIDNPAQTANLERLRSLVGDRIAYGRQSIDLIRARDEDTLKKRGATARGRRIVHAIETRIALMTSIEDRLFQARKASVENMVWLLSMGLAAAIILILVVATITIVDARRRFAVIQEARDEARTAAAAAEAEMMARKEAESQLRQIQKMESIGQLTGGIAHDFNNMLAIVIGSLDMAWRRREDPEKLERSIANAREGAERAATLTARLLAFSRQQPLAPLAVDPNRLVSNMSELLRRTLGEQIMVETVLAGGVWSTFVDPGQLENAILNLAVNARDAMPNGGKLTIESANAHLDDDYARTRGDVTAGQYVLICLSDTGTGMPKAIIERAFDPFFTTKEVGKGTGLGLSQVFGFVKQSGGHVAIYSEEGEGTTVRLYLPRHHGPAEQSALLADLDDKIPEGRTEEVILVVEDEQRVRHFSVDSLRELGYTAISADSPLQALEILRQNPAISMLFTDVVMPEMNGRRLADEARVIRPDIHILYTTGYTRNAVVHNGMLDVGVAFLPKPFTIAQLARKVRAVLDGAGANRTA